MLLDKLFVRLDRIGADSQNDSIGFPELGQTVAEVAGFGRSSRGHVSRVEEQDDIFFAFELTQADFFFRKRFRCESGSPFANLGHCVAHFWFSFQFVLLIVNTF